jgi:hypothetical protein
MFCKSLFWLLYCTNLKELTKENQCLHKHENKIIVPTAVDGNLGNRKSSIEMTLLSKMEQQTL